MKKLILTCLLGGTFLVANTTSAPIAKHDALFPACEFDGIPLYGKVQFVDAFPDIKIQYVNAFPNIKVKFVNAFPDECGEWQVVDAFPDFKVQVVDAFPDIKVQKVTAFPGMNN